MLPGALLAGLLGLGCSPPVVGGADMMLEEIEEPGLDPWTLFDTRVKPLLAASCSCHYTMQETIAPS